MQQANGDRYRAPIASAPFASPDQQHLIPINGRDYLGLYSSPIFSLSPEPDKASPLTPSDDDYLAAAAHRSFLSRLADQYHEIESRYALCLNHFESAAEEAEALRLDNARLRLANIDLYNRLGPKQIADGLRRLRITDDLTPPENSPRSVLASSVEKIPLPKSISIRSSGYLKMNPNASGSSSSSSSSSPASTRNSRLRVSAPRMVGTQRVYTESKEAAAEKEEALEFDVYNQGMFKTELCNKWEETGECPYVDHCQFAHGIGELRPVIRHPRYKTEICRMILTGEACPYGHRCHFRHALSADELSVLRPLLDTIKCDEDYIW